MHRSQNPDPRKLFGSRIDPTFFPAIVRRLEETPFDQTALVVEFRDEVFVELRARLQDFGWKVIRAERAADVAAGLNLYDPQLVLINESMPDESGSLIANKMRLNHCLPIVWLYCCNPQAAARRYGKFCGIDKVLKYDGVVQNLGEMIQSRLLRRFPEAEAIELTAEMRRHFRLY
ncbi:response regulator [Blastopirellula retiformator]|uniref:Response regulatory domain-containing protein n=1 Tax=Blastopirellula retiformator TaxID=2527970 RepID=A0A5C5VAY8_9BACT|nr:hypothetical protein [Blastopirellula retiformator]TWT34852.1 hypothetical protein Enr8_22670 [Blastopirellula retiformator]